MARNGVLPRLLRLRRLQEEQSRIDLEAAVAERNREQQLRTVAQNMLAMGRENFAKGLAEGGALSRAGAVAHMEAARLQEAWIQTRLSAAEAEVVHKRGEFLACRTDRRQTETLVEQQRSRVALEVSRRAQQMLDDWYGQRTRKRTADRHSEARRAAPEPDMGLEA